MMSPIRATLLSLALICTHFLPAAEATSFAIKDGDRVLFYGDSITEQNLYNTYVETFILTRFPDLKVDFQHAGWGGDSVNGGGGGPIDVRLDRDVFPAKPTVLTIMLGMNDGRYRAFESAIFETYAKGYRHIAERVAQELPATRVYLIQPSPYDDVTRAPLFDGGYNAVLVRFGNFVRELAAEHRFATVDFNAPVVQALQQAKALNAELAQRLINDRVHPDPSGQLLMAAALLEAWQAPAEVSTVEIDAKTQGIQSSNTKVSGLTAGRTLSWTQLDQALPFPVNRGDVTVALADEAGRFTERLNRQMLRVSGLAETRYTLFVDDEPVATLSASALAEGVNIARLPTPMIRQADQVYQIALKHNRLHYVNWRSAQLGVGEIKTPEVTRLLGQLTAEMDREEAAMVAEQRALAQPKSHRLSLRPVAP